MSPCSSLRASRKVKKVGLVHCTKNLNPRFQLSAMLDDLSKPARAESGWIELGRTVRSSYPCRFVVLGEVSHVTGDGGLQDFPGVADIIHSKEGKGLHPLKHIVI